jgi:hypothetical protein
MNRNIRRQIEWHFYNYAADEKLYQEKVKDIVETGLTVNYDKIGRSTKIADPTPNKAIQLSKFSPDKSWAAVVRNTFNTYRFEAEYDVMVDLYINKKRYSEIIKNKNNRYGLAESTFFYWRDRWLNTALMWAKEFELL